MPDLSEFLPEDLDGRDALLSKFGGEDGLARMAKSYLELERYRGRSISIPTGEDDDAAWRETMSKLGAPAEAGGYTLPEGMDDSRFGHLRESAVAGALTQRQFHSLAERAKERDESDRSSIDNQLIEAADRIKEHYGAKYETALAHARRAAKANGVEEGWEYKPEMFTILEKMGANMSGGQAPDGGDTPAPTGSARQVASRLREVMASPAYSESFHAEHEGAMLMADQLRAELREHGYSSVFHDDLLSEYSPLRGFQNQARPWQNPNTSLDGGS